jgi:hypothetical protein
LLPSTASDHNHGIFQEQTQNDELRRLRDPLQLHSSQTTTANAALSDWVSVVFPRYIASAALVLPMSKPGARSTLQKRVEVARVDEGCQPCSTSSRRDIAAMKWPFVNQSS